MELSARHACLLALAGSSGAEEAAARTIAAAGEVLHWDAAALWLIERDIARAIGVWRSPRMVDDSFELVTRAHMFAEGEGTVGEAWRSAEPIAVSDLAHDDRFTRSGAAAHAGLRAGCWVPVRSPTRVLAVLELLGAEGRATTDDVSALCAIADDLGPGLTQLLAADHRSQADSRFRLLVEGVQSAAEQEKTKLAREIHDVLGQELTGLKIDAAWIARRLAGIDAPEIEPVRERVADLMRQMDGCVQTIRRIATGLRPSVLDDLGLAEAIQWQACEFQRRSGVTVDVTLPGSAMHVDRDRSTALFRVFQEILTNVARHAQAHRVTVRLAMQAESILLDVQDDGRGIGEAEAAGTRSLGMLGMRERMALFGGTLQITGRRGAGTRVVVELPTGHA